MSTLTMTSVNLRFLQIAILATAGAAHGQVPAGDTISELRAEIDRAASDGSWDLFDDLANRVRRLAEQTSDVSDRLSTVKLASKLCWDGPATRSHSLRQFALAELMRLAPTSPRARVMLVDHFLPPLHRLATDQRAAALADDDALTEALLSAVSHTGTRHDLRFRQCMARIEAVRAWNCRWITPQERHKVDTWLAELAKSNEEAPSGGTYAELIAALQMEWASRPYEVDLSDFEASDLDGGTVRFPAFKGKVVILSFWSSWCLPCLQLAPDEARLAERLGDRAVLVGVNSDAVTSLARRAAAAHNITWPQVWSPPEARDGLVAQLGIRQWPSAILLDTNGRVHTRFIGSAYQNRLNVSDIESAVHEILALKP